jgi:hypothetical protein
VLILLRWLFRSEIPALRSLETLAGFLKLLEVCKGLVWYCNTLNLGV